MTVPDWFTTGAVLSFAVLAGPPLGVALVLGILGGLLQTTTQIREAALAFVPKVFGLVLLLALAGSVMFGAATSYAHHVFTAVPGIVHVGLYR